MTRFVGLVARMGGFPGFFGEVLNFYERKRNLQWISLWVYEKFATYCDCVNYHSFYFL